MKSERPTQSKNAPKLSGIIAKRYLALQRLREEVRKAETSCASQGPKRPVDRNQLAG